MITKISFVNCKQNGDIFMSSKFIIDITHKMKDATICYYIRLHGPNRSICTENFEFLDIPICDLDLYPEYYFEEFMKINNNTNELIINTWIGRCRRHMSEYTVHENSTYLPFFYEAFKEIYDILNIKLESLDFYIPSLNTNNYTVFSKDIIYIKNIYDNIPNKKILICNGSPFSATFHKECKILLNLIPYLINMGYFVKVTHIENINDTNILNLYYANIHKFITNNVSQDNLLINNTNLYQNELLASYSDIVVGTPSGIFFTTMTDKTLHCKFVILCDYNYRIYDKFNYTAINTGSKSYNTILNDIHNIFNI